MMEKELLGVVISLGCLQGLPKQDFIFPGSFPSLPFSQERNRGEKKAFFPLQPLFSITLCFLPAPGGRKKKIPFSCTKNTQNPHQKPRPRLQNPAEDEPKP